MLRAYMFNQYKYMYKSIDDVSTISLDTHLISSLNIFKKEIEIISLHNQRLNQHYYMKVIIILIYLPCIWCFVYSISNKFCAHIKHKNARNSKTKWTYLSFYHHSIFTYPYQRRQIFDYFPKNLMRQIFI